MIFNKITLPIVTLTQKIWDAAPHNAFTDLILFRGKWFCIFRESDSHAGHNGTLRLITTQDTIAWTSLHTWEESGYDLRDPKLSITPEGNLMLLAGAIQY